MRSSFTADDGWRGLTLRRFGANSHDFLFSSHTLSRHPEEPRACAASRRTAACARFHPSRLAVKNGEHLRMTAALQAARASTLARDLLDAGDHFVDGLVDRDFFAHHPVHRLGPDVLIVENGELVVFGELER